MTVVIQLVHGKEPSTVSQISLVMSGKRYFRLGQTKGNDGFTVTYIEVSERN